MKPEITQLHETIQSKYFEAEPVDLMAGIQIKHLHKVFFHGLPSQRSWNLTILTVNLQCKEYPNTNQRSKVKAIVFTSPKKDKNVICTILNSRSSH